MKIKKCLSACFIFTTLFLGCNSNSNADNSLQKKYGPDTDYFIGLKAVNENDTKKALRHFNKSIAQGTKYVKRRSLEQKIKLGNILQQIEGAKEYLKIYSDDAALLFACKIFFENKEYSVLIEETNSVDLSKCPNELAKMRLIAMHEKCDSRLNLATCRWFTSRKLTDDHLDFYNEYLADNSAKDSAEIEVIEPVEQDKENSPDIFENDILNTDSPEYFYNIMTYILKFRIFCYCNNFSEAYDMLNNVKQYCILQQIIPLSEFLVADIGKTYFNVSKKYLQNGNFFLELSRSPHAMNENIKYYALIYAGRIFTKSGVYYSNAEKAYLEAMNISKTDSDYDMALWFLLNSRLALSTEACIDCLEKYCGTWHDPYYFSDLLDTLSLLLFTNAKWKLFPKIYNIIEGHADNATASRFSYLTGRLMELNYLHGSEEDIKNAFIKSFELNAGTDIYYRLLSAKHLGLQIEEIEKNIFTPAVAQSAENDYEAEILLQGYADFGFEELIYPEWQYFYTINKKTFSLETITYVSEFLRSCGNSLNNNYYRSLHMMSKTSNLDNSRLNKKIFELSYPKNFSKEISHSAKEFGVDEYDMLGLIRTESFFNPVVESNVGALGLTQLMETTFQDCADKLKITDADITDPKTNIQIGTYYYSTLVQRLDSDILALFAYNAGLTRVKKWLKYSKAGLGLFKDLPSDLFLETIPFNETRNYGRKVISSAAIYAWLYYEKNPCDIIDEMM